MAILSLAIKNLAVIEKTHIHFDKGLTVITGETGAGKSVILKAIGLLIGARADNNLIRHDKDSCEVIAEFSIDELHDVHRWLNNHDFSDENNCVIRRIINRDKGSKIYINGYPANLTQLKELGQQLIDLHGQHEHQQLLHKPFQLQIIDDLVRKQDSSHESCLQQINVLFKRIQELRQRILDSQANTTEIANKLDLLTFQVNELEDLDVSDEEFESISKEYSRLSHAQELLDGFEKVQFDLSENEDSNAESILSSSLDRIETLIEFDPDLKNSIELLQSALANTQEAIGEIRAASAKTDIDSERLNFLEQRINSLVNIARKHRCSENELGTLYERISSQLIDLQKLSQSPEKLDEEMNDLLAQYKILADRCSASRERVAKQLQQYISRQMQLLGMEGGFFEIKNNRHSLENLSSNGIDDFDFLVSSNPGMPAQALNKVASGGELSRISLAIQIMGNAVNRAPTLIFDEVDVGVGGSTAEVIGNHLRELSTLYQTLCITHLPQVASKGMQHLNVNKDIKSDNSYTSTHVHQLNYDERVAEIARMLGGIHITDNTIAHAKEMLETKFVEQEI